MFDKRRVGFAHDFCTIFVSPHSLRMKQWEKLTSSDTRPVGQIFSLCASVVKLFTQDVPESLVEVTRPTDANVSSAPIESQRTNAIQFAASLETLRPGTSNDPRRWSLRAEQLMQQRSYKDVGQS
jgi:hypothetical protein